MIRGIRTLEILPSGVNPLNITLRRLFQWILITFLTTASIALVLAWRHFRGTPDNVSQLAIPPTAISSKSHAPQILRLWPGKSPGSENWTQQEMTLGNGSDKIVRNVVNPTLTAYFPPSGKSNGTAMIVCPGGGFHVISIVNEGVDVAHYLNSLGVTAFVLQYRLTRTNAAFHYVMMHRIKTPGAMDSVLRQMTPLMIADGQEAMRIVRAHAAQWGLAPNRIGIIGFSAGGFLALNVALHNSAATMPDFVAAIYPLAPKRLAPPLKRIPLFAVCAQDDPLVPPAANCERVVHVWHAGNVPAQLMAFQKGGHGFGMKKQNLPIDAWPQRLRQWLESQGFLPIPPKPAQVFSGPSTINVPDSNATRAAANNATESIR